MSLSEARELTCRRRRHANHRTKVEAWVRVARERTRARAPAQAITNAVVSSVQTNVWKVRGPWMP